MASSLSLLLFSACCLLQLFLNFFSVGCAGLVALLVDYHIATLFWAITVAWLLGTWIRRPPTSKSEFAILLATSVVVLGVASSQQLLSAYNDNHFGHMAAVLPPGSATKAVLTFSVDTMKCTACVTAVGSAVRQLASQQPWIDDFSIDLAKKQLVVKSRATASQSQSIQRIIESVEEVGHRAELLQSEAMRE